jgi:tetratricopeptide (TPR) repeat protein
MRHDASMRVPRPAGRVALAGGVLVVLAAAGVTAAAGERPAAALPAAGSPGAASAPATSPSPASASPTSPSPASASPTSPSPALSAATNGAADTAAAADYSAILDALWDFDAPAASEQRFRAERSRHPPGSREALEAATQVARTLGLQHRFAEGDALLDRLEPALRDAPARVRVRALLERGRLRNSAGQRDAAVPLFEQALRASAGDTLPGAAFYEVDALHMLGIAAPGDAGLACNRRALAAAGRARDARSRGWRASLLNNLGWTLHERGDDAQALAAWEQALALREAAGKPALVRIAKWTVARGLRGVGRLDEAEAMQRALAEEFAQAGAPDGYVYEELAELALARGRAAEARASAARAYALLKDDPDLAAREPARLARLARIAGAPGSGGATP